MEHNPSSLEREKVLGGWQFKSLFVGQSFGPKIGPSFGPSVELKISYVQTVIVSDQNNGPRIGYRQARDV